MANRLPDDLEEKPLDPEMEKVRRKMVRLLAVSIGIMFIGLMAVLGALVYKFTRPAETTGAPVSAGVPSAAPIAGEIALPAGFTVEAMALDGDRVAFHGRLADGSRRLIVHDIATGRTVADISVGERP